MRDKPQAEQNAAVLTVAIPTYNRQEAVCQAVQSLLGCWEVQADLVRVLVTDNASSDGTIAALSAIAAPVGALRLIDGESNLGWWGQVERIAEHAETEFVMLLSDEDDAGNLSQVLLTLSVKQPSFALPPRRITGRVTADSIWRNATYLSGLVIRRESLTKVVSELQRFRCESHNEFLTVYPHLSVVLLLWLRGELGTILRQMPFTSERRRIPGTWSPDADWWLPPRLAHRIDSDNAGRAAFKSLAYQLELLHDLARLIDSVAAHDLVKGNLRASFRRLLFWQWFALRTARLIDEQLAWQYPQIHLRYRRGVLRHHASPRRFTCRVTTAGRILVRRSTAALLGRKVGRQATVDPVPQFPAVSGFAGRRTGGTGAAEGD